ncbi:response regulator [Microbacterium sp. ASV81]|uniref:Transcriptional regulatory protein n=1 Tax=Microbacterium capsulatum TaxID=3041921 RepID=A0ABU0XLV6_9MICO|nr:response regulator [Microbacterium sp. ASV81]MDQ4215568.1 response regulator [Microbacterium sp. ASV81]
MIGVLIVEDDPLTLELHEAYVERIDGFETVGSCTGARAALNALTAAGSAIDLVLLDMTLPDGSGLDVLRRARSLDLPVDVIAVTSVRDVDTVRRMATLGVTQYLVKPFTFAVFRERMEQYRSRREHSRALEGAASQAEIDALIGGASTGTIGLPKGLTATTLNEITQALTRAVELSASETAEAAGVSRVTARRYLEHLTELGVAVRAARYGKPGRPETVYRRAG